MITEETLGKLLANTETIIKLAEEVNSTNLRLCSPQHELYNTLHILVGYQPGKRKPARDEDSLEDRISKLLNCPVKIWEQNVGNISEYDIEQANEYPITNSQNITEFFRDILIPTAEENEPKPIEIPVTPISGTSFWSSASQSKSAIAATIREQLNRALDALGQNPQAWAEAEELYRAKKSRALMGNSSSYVPTQSS